MKIRTRLIMAFIAVAVLPMIVAAIVVISSVRNQALIEYEYSSTSEIRQVENAIRLYFEAIEQNVQYIATHPLIESSDGSLSTYMHVRQETPMNPLGGSSLEREIFEWFTHFGDTHDGHAYVYLGTESGAYVQWPQGSISAEYDPRPRPWYRTAMNTPGRPVRTAAYYWEPDDATIVSTVMTVNNRLGRPGGVIGLDVSLNELTEIIQAISLGETGYLMLLEGDGNVLVDAANPSHNFNNISALGEAYQSIRQHQSGLQQIRLNNTRYVVNSYVSERLGWRFVGLIERSEVMAPARRLTTMLLTLMAIMLGAIVIIGRYVALAISQPINDVAAGLRNIAQGEGDLTQTLRIRRQDEVGELANWFNQFLDSIRSLVERIKHSAKDVKHSSAEETAVSSEMGDVASRQRNAVDMLSTAFHEMAATASEVAKSCSNAAAAADEGYAQAEEGKTSIDAAVTQVNNLSEEIEQSVKTIGMLEEDTQNITAILDTINSIADQTNLLALNAAIESARAGEHGRGFSVVADEVRALAQRTADSTKEIGKLIELLNQRTNEASQRMTSSREAMSSTLDRISDVSASFESVRGSVDRIRDMNTQIATAAEEQHQVAEEINQHISEVNDDAMHVNEMAEKVKATSERLAELSNQLDTLVGSFRTK
ncbi:MAG: methyl-accepting chemotaxis protein [Idiomarina sp.]|nr:methyl-accepting chemotaxis protein [Idiomarina sp.]